MTTEKMDCHQLKDFWVNKVLKQYDGSSRDYQIGQVFNIFNILETIYPEVYNDIMKRVQINLNCLSKGE